MDESLNNAGCVAPLLPASGSQAVVLSGASWADLPAELQEQIFHSLYPRERRMFCRLNKPCRQHAYQQLIKRLSVNASAPVLLSLPAASPTLAQRFSNLHTLSLWTEACTDSELLFLGHCLNLTSLSCALNSKLSEPLVESITSQLPRLQNLQLTRCKGASETALYGLRGLVSLTSLSLLSHPESQLNQFTPVLLQNHPENFRMLRSLEVAAVATVYGARDNADFAAYLTNLTRLVLDLSGVIGYSMWQNIAGSLSQLQELHHLEAPSVSHRIPASLLQPLTKLTHLLVPQLGLVVEQSTANQGEFFPNLQHLACRYILWWVHRHDCCLSTCTYLEICGSGHPPEYVQTAIQLCPELTHLTVSATVSPWVFQQFIQLRNVVSQVPAVRVCLLFNTMAGPPLPALQFIEQLHNWRNCKAASITWLGHFDNYIDPLTAALDEVISLSLKVDCLSESDLLRLCGSMPRLRELVVTMTSRDSQLQFQHCTEGDILLLSSGPTSNRQLRISIVHLPAVRVWELNRDLQDLGCDGVRFDNTAKLEFW